MTNTFTPTTIFTPSVILFFSQHSFLYSTFSSYCSLCTFPGHHLQVTVPLYGIHLTYIPHLVFPSSCLTRTFPLFHISAPSPMQGLHILYRTHTFPYNITFFIVPSSLKLFQIFHFFRYLELLRSWFKMRVCIFSNIFLVVTKSIIVSNHLLFHDNLFLILYFLFKIE